MTSIRHRRLAAVVLLAIGILHLGLMSDYLEDAFSVGVLFFVSFPVSSYLAVRLWVEDDRLAWLTGGVISIGMVLAFLASRTVGFLGFEDSTWDAWGVVSLVLESAFVVLAAPSLLHPSSIGRHTPPTPAM